MCIVPAAVLCMCLVAMTAETNRQQGYGFQGQRQFNDVFLWYSHVVQSATVMGLLFTQNLCLL